MILSKYLISWTCSLFVITLSIWANTPSSSIKVGMAAPFTGPSAYLGQSLLRGIEPAIDRINASGGIHGRELELIYRDDQYHPERTLRVALDLIQQDAVDVLFSFVGTPTVHKITPLLLKYDMPLYFPFTGADFLRKPPFDRYIFNYRASYFDETRALVHHFVTQGKTKIAVYYQLDTYGQTGLSGVRKALATHKLLPYRILNYRRGKLYSDNFDSEAALFLKDPPDAILCISTYSAAAGLIKAIRSYSDIPIGIISFVDSEAVRILLTRESSDMFENIVASRVVAPELMSVDDFSYYQSVMGPDFDEVAFEGYLNTLALADFLSRRFEPDLNGSHDGLMDLQSLKRVFLFRDNALNQWEPL